MSEKNPKPRVSAVIPAAGASSRKGTPKHCRPSGPASRRSRGAGREASSTQTLLERVVENIRRSHVKEIVVVPCDAAEESRRRIPLEGVRVVVNEDYGGGMGRSLRAGLSEAGRAVPAAVDLGGSDLPGAGKRRRGFSNTRWHATEEAHWIFSSSR
jgi:CTP:molybdopterin cytidylyltransferase MocA